MSQREELDFLTFPEVQTYLGIKSRKTLLKYIKSGKLPAYKVGGTRWRILRSDVEGFLNGCLITSNNDQGNETK